jgi:hypothetical protein
MVDHNDLNQSHEVFVHIRIIIGMILALSVARLITGATRFIQHPGQSQIDLLHIGWVVFIFLSIIDFWWFEFALSRIEQWTFGDYLLVVCYAVVFFMLSAILFPDNVGARAHVGEYFWDRRNIFYTIFLISIVVDIIDTALKGYSYYSQLYGWYYPARQCFFIVGTIGVLLSSSKRHHLAFVVLALALQIVWIVTFLDVLESK